MSENNNKKQNSSNNKVSKVKKSYFKPKKDFTFLTESKYVEKWLLNVNSRDARLSVLYDFCKFVNKTPEELVNEHYEDSQQKPLERKDIAKNQLHSFYKFLIEKISSNSARQYVYSKLASFYKRNNVPVYFQKGEIPNAILGVRDKVWRNGDMEAIDETKNTLKQIRDTLSTVRDRTILLCKISSGMDDVDLFKLKIGDYKKGYRGNGLNICYIEGFRQKNTQCYFQTFFNSEACNMMEIYLKERELKGEQLNDNSWLFVKTRANARDSRIYNRIERRSFPDALKETCEKLGVKNITPKQLRVWFSSESKSKIEKPQDDEIIERMMGHIGNVSKYYQNLFTNPKRFAEYYKKNIEFSTLLGNGDVISKEHSKKLEEHGATIKTLTKQLTDIQKENKELREIVNQVPKLVESYEALSKQNKIILSHISDKEIIEKLGLKASKKGKAKKIELDNEKEENGDD